MMRMKTLVLGCVIVLLGSGCVGHYRFESRGEVKTSSNEPNQAVLYWFGDDGRLWYGKRYQAPDSDLTMMVCRATPKDFAPAPDTNEGLQLSAEGGEHQIAKIDSNGMVVNVSEPKMLRTGSSCGQISLAGKAVSTEDLTVGKKPEVIILCENQENPDGYPAVGRYKFQAITKTEVKENTAPKNNCSTP